MSNFMSALKETADKTNPNVSITENGAVGYETTGKNLVDLNFALSSMRNMSEGAIWEKFILAYNEDPRLAILWLFLARDVRAGCGERRTFRVIFKRLCYENADLAVKLLPLVSFYGRWDDLTDVFFGEVPCKVRNEALRIINEQLSADVRAAKMHQGVSLLAKWLPSLNTSSKETRYRAEQLRSALEWTPKQYRKIISNLRSYIKIVEQKMSANEWDQIDYGTVPSRAAMNYRDAFRCHDEERYDEYLANVKEGKEKINAGVLFPYDIVRAYMVNPYHTKPVNDPTLEEQWKALPNKVGDNGSTLVVVDGSGSMSATIAKTNVTCHDVARSLGIYFSERLQGQFHNQFITFSANPKLVRFDDTLSLHNRLNILIHHDECSNTNIQRVFDLILDTAIAHRLPQSEIPANILIVSDMEFDQATYTYVDRHYQEFDETLFDAIKHRWESHGYKLPRLVFWNVCSRTGTIPVTTNDLGVALVSGFSPNIADMVLSGELDPYKCLVDKLTSGRYKQVEDALKG